MTEQAKAKELWIDSEALIKTQSTVVTFVHKKEEANCFKVVLADSIKQLEAENEQLKIDLENTACPICKSCGIDECCAAERCKFPDIKSDTVKFHKEIAEDLEKENAALKSRLEKQNHLLFDIANFLCERIIDPCGYDPEKESLKDLVEAIKSNSSDNEKMLIKVRETLMNKDEVL